WISPDPLPRAFLAGCKSQDRAPRCVALPHPAVARCASLSSPRAPRPSPDKIPRASLKRRPKGPHDQRLALAASDRCHAVQNPAREGEHGARLTLGRNRPVTRIHLKVPALVVLGG